MITITTRTPTEGATSGGTELTINGTDFVPGLTVTVGGAPASVISVTPNAIICRTGLHVPGLADILVTNPAPGSEIAVLPNGFKYVDPAPHANSPVSPISGPTPGGTSLTISGTGFQAGATVSCGGVPCTMTSVTATSISCVTSAHVPGLCDIIVTNPDGQFDTLAGAFTYANAGPAVQTIVPDRGPEAGATLVAIGGTGFQPGAMVTIGGVPATVSSIAPTEIKCNTGPHIAGLCGVVVNNPDAQSDTRPDAFTYGNLPPQITNVTPDKSVTAGGADVVITGSNFQAGATVTFGGTLGNVTAVVPNRIDCTTPAHVTGRADVVVTNPDFASDIRPLAMEFADPAPDAQNVAPTTCVTAGGTSLTISGHEFRPGATVAIGGIPAVVSTVAENAITCVSPPHVAGFVDIVVTNPGGLQDSLPGVLNYADPAPSPVSVVPPGGPTAGGTVVTITGTGFQSGATVSFGGALAAISTVSSNAIVCATGPHAALRVGVLVTNPDGQSGAKADVFTYADPAPNPLTYALPPGTTPSTTGGYMLTINGTDFVPGATVTIGGSPAAVSTVSPTQITCIVPPHISGTVPVVVVNPDGQSATLPTGFIYQNVPPAPTFVTPPTGAPAGGTPVSVIGSDFIPGLKVQIDGADALVSVVLPNFISCIAPAHAAGAAALDVVVINPDGLRGTKSNAFTYV